jgi:hypothetical protein
MPTVKQPVSLVALPVANSLEVAILAVSFRDYIPRSLRQNGSKSLCADSGATPSLVLDDDCIPPRLK